MEGNEYIKDKSKDDLLISLYKDSQVGSKVHEQQKMAIFVKCTEDFERVIKSFDETNSKLSMRIFWLNLILGLFTIIGTVVSVYAIFFKE